MLRKHKLTERPTVPTRSGEMDIAAVATVWITSEAEDHPIDNVFDTSRGPGGSCWVSGETGEQALILAFDTPQTIRTIRLEAEEPHVSRTQELHLSISQDSGQTYQELLRQEYNFSPPGTTFEREEWSVTAEGITHLQLIIKPDKSGRPCRATLTSLAIQS